MNVKITKGARQFGYLIWNSKNNSEMEKLLEGKESVRVNFNGFDLGMKNVDRKYHRISLGYKLTRALPATHDTFRVKINNAILEVKSFDGNN